MAQPALVVSGIGRRNALVRLLLEECRRLGLVLIGCDASPYASAGTELTIVEQVPLAQDPDFDQAYAEVLNRHRPLGYMTLVDPEVTALAMLAWVAPFDASQFLHPSWTTTETCEDKLAFAKLMSSRNVPSVPTSLTPLDDYPQVCKDRRGSAASGFRVLTEGEPTAPCGPDVVFQPWCDGRHFCIDAYFSLSSGELVDYCVKEVLDKRHGESLLVRSVAPEPFRHLVVRGAEVLPMRGIVNLDVYGDESDQVLMEVNCRIGGNYPATHAFGTNLLRPLLSELTSGVPATPVAPVYVVGRHVASHPAYTTLECAGETGTPATADIVAT